MLPQLGFEIFLRDSVATELLEAKVLAATAALAEVLAEVLEAGLIITITITILTVASVAAASEVVVGSKASFRP